MKESEFLFFTLLGSYALLEKFVSRGVARSKYVGWTDMASAEREPITGFGGAAIPLLLRPPVKTRRICINLRSDL